MKTVSITVTVGGKEETYTARKLKFRERMRIAGFLRKGMPPPEQDVAEDGQPLVDAKGGAVYKTQAFPMENIGEYQVALIHASICNEAGKPFYTPEEIDEWEDERIREVATKLGELNKSGDNAVEEARGNSTSAIESSSSS